MRGLTALLAVLLLGFAAPHIQHDALVPRPADLSWRGRAGRVAGILAVMALGVGLALATGAAPLLLVGAAQLLKPKGGDAARLPALPISMRGDAKGWAQARRVDAGGGTRLGLSEWQSSPHARMLGWAAPRPADEIARQVLGLSAKSDVTNLIPADVFSRQVLEALYAERQFTGIIAGVMEDLTGKGGDTVQVPYIGARTAQGSIAEGAALTATATSTGTYSVTLNKYGDYDLVNREVWEDQKIFSQLDFLRNIGQALAQKVDQIAYDEVAGATPNKSQTLDSAGVLTDLYDKVVNLKAAMRKDKVRPSDVLIGPDQEAQLLKDTSEGIKHEQVAVRDGQVLRIAGLNAIVSPLANASVATAGAVQAVVIDRSRALVEAWGRRPQTIVDETSKAETDQIKLVTWLRYNAAEADTKAIGHVKNP